MTCDIHGDRTIRAITMATILGMKVSVASFICVIACKILTARPTIRAAKSIGAESSSVVIIASLPMPITISSVIDHLYPKERTKEPTTSSQPSTKTNNKSLNGREITTGGNIIMPIAIRTLATTMSMMRNGR